jgi:hypothetical protein
MTQYINGYTIKPAKINALGIVEFTDGVNPVTPNQQQCQAYGYTYDPITGTCKAFNLNTNINKNIENVNNNIQGAGNVTGIGTNNTYIMGEDNTVQGLSANNIITGTNNFINSGINNACVYGRLGESTAENSIVLGGNAPADILGERQSIQLAWVERGVAVQISETVTISRERDLIKSSGSVSNWRPAANNTGSNFRITVRGDADQTVEWCSNITITQLKTGL